MSSSLLQPGSSPAGLEWASALDRHLLHHVRGCAAQQHLAPATEAAAECLALVREIASTAPGWARGWLHVGFASVLLGAAEPAPAGLDTEREAWFRFGEWLALSGQGRHAEVLVGRADAVVPRLLASPAAADLRRLFVVAAVDQRDWELALEAAGAGSGDGLDDERRRLVAACAARLRDDAALVDEEERQAMAHALRCLSRAEAEAEWWPLALRTLGELHLLEGSWDAARAAMERLLAATPVGQGDRPGAHVGAILARARARDATELTAMRARETEVAEAAERAIAELDPPPPEAAFVLGLARLRQSRFEEAAALLRGVVEAGSGAAATGVAAAARLPLARALLGLPTAARHEAEIAGCLDRAHESLQRSSPDTILEVVQRAARVSPDLAAAACRHLDEAALEDAAAAILMSGELLGANQAEAALAFAERALALADRPGGNQDRLDAHLARLKALADLKRHDAAMSAWEQLAAEADRRRQPERILRVLEAEQGADADLANWLFSADERLEWRIHYLGLRPQRDAETADLRGELARRLVAERAWLPAKQVVDELCKLAPELAEGVRAWWGRESPAGETELAPPGVDELAARLRVRFPSPPVVVVFGGNETQHHGQVRLKELGRRLHFREEWQLASYQPGKDIAWIDTRLQRGDVAALLILHWNRTGTTRQSVELAKKHGVPCRRLYYGGFTYLELALRALLAQVAEKVQPLAT